MKYKWSVTTAVLFIALVISEIFNTRENMHNLRLLDISGMLGLLVLVAMHQAYKEHDRLRKEYKETKYDGSWNPS